MKYLITGATGFVGSNIAKEFVNQGEEVIALARKTSRKEDIDFLRDLGAEVRYVKDYSDIKNVVGRADRVIHAAASTGEWINRQHYEANIQGTRIFLNASLESKIDRFIFISSLGVMGLKNHYRTGTETDYKKTNDFYLDSKIESEKLVKEFYSQYRLPITILRPGFVYGERDRRLMKRMLESLEKGRFRFIGDGKNKMNLVYAGNFADAVYLSTKTSNAVGQTYNVTDDNGLDIETFVYKICDLWGFKRPIKHVPIPLAKTAAFFIEGLARLVKTKEPPLLTKTRLKFLSLNLDFDISKTREDLGYEPNVDIDEGLNRVKKWIETENPYSW
ncbi:MAG: NAD-dependent epimerase/dehydratase family protein [Nanoarchaeota archaeon]